MGTVAGVGYSGHRNAPIAGREAAEQALEKAGISNPDLVLVFATVGYHQEALIRAVREATADAPLSGCSGEGIIAQGISAESNFGVCVMVVSSDSLRFTNLRVPSLQDGSGPAGSSLGRQLRPILANDAIACLLFADGLSFDFDPFRSGFEAELSLPRALPLFGGLSADNWALKQTFQYHDDEVISGGLSCVLISGQGSLAWGINHGCVPIGTRHTITRCKGNIIYEIDGVRALEALKGYLDGQLEGQWNKISLNLCLGFKAPQEFRDQYGDFVVRYMVSKDDEIGSVTIQSDVEPGTHFWMVRRDKELIREGISTIVRQVRERCGAGRPAFALQFECMGRGKVVFREQEKSELQRLLQRGIGEDVPWIGFYTYGEIGPVAAHNCIHNFTAVVAVMC